MAFIRFGRLPVEIRMLIWGKSLETDVIFLRSVWTNQINSLGDSVHRSWLSSLPDDDGRNHSVPQTTKEARHIAMSICNLRPVPICNIIRVQNGLQAEWKFVTKYVHWTCDLFYIQGEYLEVLQGAFPLSPTSIVNFGPPPIRRVVLQEDPVRRRMHPSARFNATEIEKVSKLDEVYILFTQSIDPTVECHCDQIDPKDGTCRPCVQLMSYARLLDWTRANYAPQAQICGYDDVSLSICNVLNNNL